MDMDKFSFILLILLSFSTELVPQNNYQAFYKKILTTHKNSSENDLNKLNKAIDNNRKYSVLLANSSQKDFTIPQCEYEFITCYRVNFKKMCSAKKRNLKRENFFNYLSTNILYISETYVFCKGGDFLGSLRNIGYGDTEKLLFVDGDNIKVLAENFYNQIYKKTKPILYFYTRIPFVQGFIIVNDSIKPINYDEDFNWEIRDIPDFINDEKFKNINGYMNNGYEFVE